MIRATWAAPEVRAAIDACGPVEPIDGVSWKLLGGGVPVVAQVLGSWLHFDAAAEPGQLNGHAQELLERNADLPPGLKLAVPTGEDSIRLRAEITLDRDLALESRVTDTVRRVRQAAAWRGGIEASSPAPVPRDLTAVGELVRASGWPVPEGAAEPPHVDLEVPHVGALARIGRRRHGELEIVADLEVDPTSLAAPVCRAALGRHLLAVGAEVRLVRAAVFEGRPCFEVLLDPEPPPVEVAHALHALSVACAGAAREAQALHASPALAHRYVALSQV